MGGLFQTEKMKNHVRLCAVCKIAHLAPEGADYSACCEEYLDMIENVVDFECGEGPFENKR